MALPDELVCAIVRRLGGRPRDRAALRLTSRLCRAAVNGCAPPNYHNCALQYIARAVTSRAHGAPCGRQQLARREAAWLQYQKFRFVVARPGLSAAPPQTKALAYRLGMWMQISAPMYTGVAPLMLRTGATAAQARDATWVACRYGRLEFVKWSLRRFGPGCAVARRQLFDTARALGHAEVLGWLAAYA